MPKGYWIAHVEISDPERYALYVDGAKDVFGRYGGRFLARGGAYEEVEGALGRARHVVIEFPSLQAARDCYHSPDYQAAKAHRLPAATATVTLVEGVD